MGIGVKMVVVVFNVDYKMYIVEIMCFGGGIKFEEGDLVFIDICCVFQVGSGDVQCVVYFYDINNGMVGFFC